MSNKSDKKIVKQRQKIKKEKQPSLWKEGTSLFNGISIFFQLLLYSAVNFLVAYLLTENIMMSLIIGCASGFVLYLSFSVLQTKTNRYQNDLKDLMKYVTTMTFHLKTGKNEMAAFRDTRKAMPKHIQTKIDIVLKGMETEAKLDTSCFKIYNFPALDVFHQILDIKYKHGGDPHILFNPINMMMSDEITKRDSLYRRKKSKALELYSMWGMVFAIPLLLVIMPSTLTLYKIFLSYKFVSFAIICVFYLCMIWNAVSIQKEKIDISVR